MGTAEVIKYLDDNQFGKKSYRELSAKSNKNVSLLLSDKTEAYDFDDITKYIFPKYTPSSTDAILIKTNKIIRDFSTKKDCRITTVIFFCWKIYSTIVKCI